VVSLKLLSQYSLGAVARVYKNYVNRVDITMNLKDWESSST